MKPRGMIVIHQFRPITGGAELQAERLAAKLVQRGHSMQVMTQLRSPESAQDELLSGVKVHRVNFPMAYRLDRSLKPTIGYFIAHRRSYDVLHAQQAFGHAVAAVVAACCLRKKCIIKIACSGSYGDLSVLSTFKGFDWAIRVLRRAHCVIAVSSQIEKELISDWGFSPKRIQRIPNGVDTDHFRRYSPPQPAAKIRFILIGRRQPQKGIDTALLALKLLRAGGLDHRFELKLYGRDFDEYDYRRMAAELAVTDMVEFLPHADDMHAVYESAHSMILPSRGEGLSNSLLEAMSMQLAVVATPVSGTTDVVEEGTDALLVPPGSPDALAHAMSTIIKDADTRQSLGQHARRKVSERFSLESVSERYSGLYSSLTRQAAI